MKGFQAGGAHPRTDELILGRFGGGLKGSGGCCRFFAWWEEEEEGTEKESVRQDPLYRPEP